MRKYRLFLTEIFGILLCLGGYVIFLYRASNYPYAILFGVYIIAFTILAIIERRSL